MFHRLLSILSIKLNRVLKGRIKLHVLLVIVNPINKILPCAEGQDCADFLPVTVNPIDKIVPCSEGQDSAACFADYCQSYQ